jgi:glucosamine-6-phosphate deaminase
MDVIVCKSAQSATDRAAAILIEQIRHKPDSVLGLATGGTMEPLYAKLVTAYQNGMSFAQIKSFNLDEYIGLPPSHLQSYAHYMSHHLFNHTDIAPQNLFLPCGTDAPAIAAQKYEDELARHGPIDLQLLGLGHNGHIGFNEPGSSHASRTRVTTLSDQTLDANRRFFSKSEKVPQSAITMGIGTICESRRILLLANGIGKAQAVRAMIEGPVDTSCPASALQLHDNVTIVIDDDAACSLHLMGP